MKLTKVLQGAVLCAVLFMVYSDESSSNNHDAKRRRCRCKKYIDKLTKDIDKRFQAFESKFEKYAVDYNTIPNITSDIQMDQTDKTLNSLSADMTTCKEILQKESYSLRQLKEDVFSQEINVERLSDSFKSLDLMVKNLTDIVEKLEQTVRSSKEITMNKHNPKKDKRKPIIPETYPKDCDEVYQSGGMKYLGDYYILVQPEKATTPFKTVCKIIDGAGWTVIQRRQNGRENFSRDWEEYKNGFGDLQNEFWLGNEKLHLLTTQDDYELKIDMQEWGGKRFYAEYDRFRVSSEDDLYRLHVSGYHGTAGDSLTPYWRSHDGMPFSTRDRDNDNRFYDNCAEHYGGGWWYNDCFESHLNGRYYQNGSHNNYFVRNGIQWNSIHSYSSLKFVEIMIKPSDNVKLPNDI